MAKHKVTFSVNEDSIMNRDIIFKVFQDNRTLGDLYISKGGVDWRSRHKQYAHHSFSWEEFVRRIETE